MSSREKLTPAIVKEIGEKVKCRSIGVEGQLAMADCPSTENT